MLHLKRVECTSGAQMRRTILALANSGRRRKFPARPDLWARRQIGRVEVLALDFANDLIDGAVATHGHRR
jgi:hypothetical protein